MKEKGFKMNKIAIYVESLKKKKFSNERLLNDKEILIAKFLGIKKYSKVKVVEISRVDFKGMLNEESNMLLERFNLVKDSTNAITFDIRIFIFKSDDMRKTVAHELVHVYQYETLGVDGFVQEYLNEVIGKTDKKKIALEIPAYKFGEDFKNNGYSLDNIYKDTFNFIP